MKILSSDHFLCVLPQHLNPLTTSLLSHLRAMKQSSKSTAGPLRQKEFSSFFIPASLSSLPVLTLEEVGSQQGVRLPVWFPHRLLGHGHLMKLSLCVHHCSHNHTVAQILFQTKLCSCSWKHQCSWSFGFVLAWIC